MQAGSGYVFGQEIPDSEAAFDKEYAKNIEQEYLLGVYIPKDLEDAFSEIIRLSDPADLEKYKAAPEEVVVRKLHFGLGKWISYNWNFVGGSRFSHYLKSLNLHDPDDMVEFVLSTLHRHLNGRELMVEEKIAEIQKKREEIKLKKEKEGEVIFYEKRKIPRQTDSLKNGHH
jgi:hypothetical protein